jgi:multicomponent Na+:H+ antiporter subunit E
VKTAQASAGLYAFWLAITGSLRPYDLAVGLVLSILLGVWAARFLWPTDAPVLSLRQAWRFSLYIPRLIVSIVVAAVQVAEVVLEPRMPIEPVMLHHRAVFDRDVSRVAFANSITLTPGTLTVDVEDSTYVVHCIAERFAEEIESGELERVVSRVFEE